jgi:hypothetical protein
MDKVGTLDAAILKALTTESIPEYTVTEYEPGARPKMLSELLPPFDHR